jgi:hypothetical protein
MGVVARAVAVAAFPVVLLEIVAGKSAEVSERKAGVVAGPEPGPARTVLAVWWRSCGAKVPLAVIGEPETVELKMIPSPVIPTLVTVPLLAAGLATNMVRTSISEEMAVLPVMTFAMGMVKEGKPVVLNAGAQLLEGLR